MSEVLAYHVVLGNYGFWLPNDPRGSGSVEVRSERLKPFGRASYVESRRSVAGAAHDRRLRLAAKDALVRPPVVFDGHQALSVGRGFATAIAASGHVLHACSILPQHTHLVIRRHHYSIEQVVRRLRQSATNRLLADGRHPFAAERSSTGRLPSVWGQDFWKVFLFTSEQIRRAIEYVEQNPERDGKKPQRWKFVVPFDK